MRETISLTLSSLIEWHLHRGPAMALGPDEEARERVKKSQSGDTTTHPGKAKILRGCFDAGYADCVTWLV